MYQKEAFIIAEAGINHGGDVGKAMALVEAAKEAGADAIKFQTYQADLRSNPSQGAYEILKRCELSYEQTADVKWHADKVGIEFFSTPFDEHSLAFLVEDLGVRRVKIASMDLTNRIQLVLINECAKRYAALKVVMSTGMANPAELSSALTCLPDVNSLAVLHCVSSYPTPEHEVNLSAIKTLRRLLHGRIEVGYSDHTNDILVPSLSVFMGATVVEKHFTLDLNDGSPDNAVSADPRMMRDMIDAIREHESMLGDGTIGLQDIEQGSVPYRRYS